MKYFYTLILLLSLILLQSCTTKKVDHSSEEAVEDLKSTEGVLYLSRKGRWTSNEEENSDRKYLGETKNGRPNGQ